LLASGAYHRSWLFAKVTEEVRCAVAAMTPDAGVRIFPNSNTLLAHTRDRCGDNGTFLHYVSKQLGHSSIKITVDYDGHLVPTRRRVIVNRMTRHRWRRNLQKSAEAAARKPEGK
jgi:hypothetical protein